jgi:hypothetical protein
MTEEVELCKYCGDTVEDCISAEECNEAIGRTRPDDDDLYEAYKDRLVDDYYASKE